MIGAVSVVGAIAILVVPAAAVEDQRFGGFRIDRRESIGAPAGEIKFLSRNCVAQQIASGRVPAVVAVVIGLGWALVGVTPIVGSCEIEVGGTELGHPMAGRIRARLRHTGDSPEHVEVVSCVTAVAFWAVRSDAHSREELSALGFIEEIEQDGCHTAFAVVFVGLDPGVVIAVGDCPFSDIEAQQAAASFDREAHFWIIDSGLLGQDQADGQGESRRVHHSVAAQSPVAQGEAMSPGADGALAFCGLESQALEAWHDRPIVGSQHVFREEHDAVSVVPCLHASGVEVRGPLGFLLNQREVFGVSACQESQSVEGSGDGILAAWLRVGGLGHAIGEGLAAEFEEPLGFRAIVGCRWAVGPEDFAGELDFDRLSSSPAGQMEFPGTLLRFGESDCVGEFGSGI